MSIVALVKCTLIGLLREQKEVLEELQALGCLHLEPLCSVAVVFISFVAFFAIMLADVGYALVLLGLLWLLRRRLPADFKVLGSWAAGVLLVWGIRAGAYFGYVLPPWLASVQGFATTDFAALMKSGQGEGRDRGCMG